MLPRELSAQFAVRDNSLFCRKILDMDCENPSIRSEAYHLAKLI